MLLLLCLCSEQNQLLRLHLLFQRHYRQGFVLKLCLQRSLLLLQGLDRCCRLLEGIGLVLHRRAEVCRLLLRQSLLPIVLLPQICQGPLLMLESTIDFRLLGLEVLARLLDRGHLLEISKLLVSELRQLSL